MPANPPPVNVKIKGQDRISRTLSTVGAKLRRFGGGVTRAGRTMSMRMTLPLVLMGGAAISAAGNFEASMKTLEGIVGNVGAPAMTAMSDRAKELGATTMFSASQAAEGMTSLAKVGLNVKQVIDAVGPSLELAASEEVELGEAAAVVAFNLKRFNLEASQANRIAQLVGATASRTGTNFTDMEESMVKLGPVLGKMGFQIEEVAALIGVLGDGGILGARAGAALATSFSRLAKPTGEMQAAMDKYKISLFDANEEVKPMAQFVDELARKLGPLTPKMKDAAISTIFGARALGQWKTVIDRAGPGFTEVQKKITDTTMATDKAALKMAGFNGAMKALKSALEAVAIAIGEAGVLQFLTDLANKLAGVFRNLAKTNPQILKIGFVVAAAAAALGPLLVMIGLMASGLGALATALKLVIIPFKIISFLISVSPIGALIVGIALLTTGIILLIKNWDRVVSKFKSGFAILKKVGGVFKAFFGGGAEAGGPETAAPTAGAGAISRSVEESRRTTVEQKEARVKVEFENTPPARITTDNEGVDLEQDIGFAPTG